MRKKGKYEAPAPVREKPPRPLLQTYFISLISLGLCCVMFLGTTFAWFTNEVTSSGNEINIGTLDADLLHWEETDWVSVKSHPDHKVFDSNIGWEPGHSETETLAVKNGGDLAFTYSLQLILSDSDDDETLTDAEIEEIAGCFEVSYQEKTEVSTIADEEETWTVVQNEQGEDATLADILLNRIPVFSGEMKGEKEETKIYDVRLTFKEDADSTAAMGKKLVIDVKLVATQLNADAMLSTVTVTPANMKDMDFKQNNVKYVFSGEFKDIEITTDVGLTQVFDGKNATVTGKVLVNAPGVAHAYANLKEKRSGTVTVTGFTADVLNVCAYNNEEVKITDNTVKAMSVIGGNFKLTLDSNKIDGDFTAYDDGENQPNKYGISLRICDYELYVTNNEITDTLSHAIDLNGRQAEDDLACRGESSKISEFSGNKITVNTTADTGRAALKIWNDAAYDPINVSEPNEAAKALINGILADGTNQFHLGESHYIFCIDTYKTSESIA